MGRWLCRFRLHRWWIGSWNLAGNQSYRERKCKCCGRREQQHLTWGGKPTGPWRHDVRPPCTHGVGGVSVLFCMNCAVERQERGLR